MLWIVCDSMARHAARRLPNVLRHDSLGFSDAASCI